MDAVKNGRIFYFPCALTCRAATNTGNFVGWLSSRIYADQFSRKASQVQDDKILRSRKLRIDLPYVKDARITYSGNGVIPDANRPGFLARFFMKLWPL